MDKKSPQGVVPIGPIDGTAGIPASPNIASPNIASPNISSPVTLGQEIAPAAPVQNIATVPTTPATPVATSVENAAPMGAVSIDEVEGMSGAVDIADIMGEPDATITPSPATAPAISEPTAVAEPIANVPTPVADSAAMPNIAGGAVGNDATGLIDSNELANMSEEDLAAEAAGEPKENLEGVEDLADDNIAPEQPASVSEEEIAAREAAQRAESEASLAEASASMQNLHQNIMPEKKKEEKIEASISSKARKKIKLSGKAKAIIIVVAILLISGGTLTYLIMTGFFNYKSYDVGNFVVRIDESKYNVTKDNNKIKVKTKDDKLEFTLADLDKVDHLALLDDVAGMNRLFADVDMKVDSSSERTLTTTQCAVYKTIHKSKKYISYVGFCNVGDYMIQIDATSSDNGAKAEDALIQAGEIVSAARHK